MDRHRRNHSRRNLCWIGEETSVSATADQHEGGNSQNRRHVDGAGIIDDDQLRPGDQRSQFRKRSLAAQVGQSAVLTRNAAAQNALQSSLYGDVAADEKKVVERPGAECLPRLRREQHIGAFPAGRNRLPVTGGGGGTGNCCSQKGIEIFQLVNSSMRHEEKMRQMVD